MATAKRKIRYASNDNHVPWRALASALALVLASSFGFATDAPAVEIVRSPADGASTPVLGSASPTPEFETLGDDGPTFEYAPTAIRLRIPLAGPSRWLCARTDGAPFARSRCGTSEATLDPTALRLCRSATGALHLSGANCGKGDSTVDMRKVRGVTPAAWRTPTSAKSLSSPAATTTSGFEIDSKTIEKSPEPKLETDPSVGAVDPIVETKLEIDVQPTDPGAFGGLLVRDGLCLRKDGAPSLHPLCPSGETPIGPDELHTCVDGVGAVALRGTPCGKSTTAVDLREFRTPGAPVGIGPLVGILPRLADLPDEYPGL